MLLQLGSVPFTVVSSAELSREFLKTHETDIIRPRTKAVDVFFKGCSDVAFCQYGEYYRQSLSF